MIIFLKIALKRNERIENVSYGKFQFVWIFPKPLDLLQSEAKSRSRNYCIDNKHFIFNTYIANLYVY